MVRQVCRVVVRWFYGLLRCVGLRQVWHGTAGWVGVRLVKDVASSELELVGLDMAGVVFLGMLR